MKPIDAVYNDSKDALAYLLGHGEISLKTTTERDLTKAFLLAVASYFEDEVKKVITEFAAIRSNNTIALVNFLQNKAILRQYHTLFNWDAKNANQFFGLFGEVFRDKTNIAISTNVHLKDSISAFIEIGRLRNQLVHQNFATFVLEKTLDELYASYNEAMHFIDILPKWFDEHC